MRRLSERRDTLEDDYRKAVSALRETPSLENASSLERIVREYFEVLDRNHQLHETIVAVELITDEDYWNMVGLQELTDLDEGREIPLYEDEIDIDSINWREPVTSEPQTLNPNEVVGEAVLREYREGIPLSDDGGEVTKHLLERLLDDEVVPDLAELASDHREYAIEKKKSQKNWSRTGYDRGN